MRKYRIWDSNQKEYLEEPDGRWMLSRKGKLYNSEVDEWYEVGERFIVEYSTGLKDKNNKEVYEGDIVKLSEDWHFREFELCVIEYHKYGIPYIIQRYLKNCPGSGDYNFDYMKDSCLSGVETYYEIIGNINQNPELLNV